MLFRFFAVCGYHGWYKACVSKESALAGIKVEQQRIRSVIRALEERIEFMRIQFVHGGFTESDQRTVDLKTSAYIQELEFLVEGHRSSLEKKRYWEIFEGAIPPGKDFEKDYCKGAHGYYFLRRYDGEGTLVRDDAAWPWRVEEIERLEREYG